MSTAAYINVKKIRHRLNTRENKKIVNKRARHPFSSLHSSSRFTGFRLSGAYTVQTRHLNVRGIAYRSAAIISLTACNIISSQNLYAHLLLISYPFRDITWISCFPLFSPTDLELPASPYSRIPVTSCF